MRTLNRPMFNMGGPIKQGIMHGIREPHQVGKIVTGAGTKVMPHIRRGFDTFKNWFGKTKPGSTKDVYTGYSEYGPATYKTVTQPGGWIPKPWVERDPIFQIGKKAWEGKGLLGKPLKWAGKTLATPTGAIGAGALSYSLFWPDGTKKTKEELAAEGQHGPFNHSEKKLAKKAQAAFAEAQRDTRVQKYLDLMGYDRSKKTAVADALIDASKLVSDRGTLEKKNITRDLINPIIQATSKRFDKPEQIREAVGLMMVKGEIQKDLEDPTVKALRLEQLKDLRGGFAKDLGDFVLSAKGTKVKKESLQQYARVKANEYGLPFTVVDETTVMGEEPGVYMVEDKIFRVDENGQAEQIV